MAMLMTCSEPRLARVAQARVDEVARGFEEVLLQPIIVEVKMHYTEVDSSMSQKGISCEDRKGR